MDLQTIFEALILGTVEGLTEFIPVSSTGHLLLLGHFMGFENPGKTFEVLIQLGSILAILSVYFSKLWQLFISLPSDPRSRYFVAGILLAFLPAAVIGFLAHDFIKAVLFASPALICTTLFLGGLVLLWVDRLDLKPRYHDVAHYPMHVYLAIGCCQVLAMVPGVSRSGSTIVGALLLGTDKRSAAEFSFFLAMPTMAGAFALDLFKNRDLITLNDAAVIGVGFVTAFIAGVVVVRWLLDYVSRHGFSLFAWWRIIVGLAGFAGLYLFG
ncbi:undecaprenyl-diphosphatase [Breoghania corrubedonensis]|uniref:Undecaprenyl-diphosphatase n=1 Tax=Breoghania corrubedonensis TaxID=665038 RepID=A0A2T5VFW3_9HYPH|nr:undecaprenyl-diphosphate phosphatase [Breoghania corrubedonensis]PTW62645.1 undecaprenyl-diphosphatase [Breoghania corrubedonensis]